MNRLRALTLAALFVAIPRPAHAQLVSQAVVGTGRVCGYTNPDIMARRTAPVVYHRTARGEPCPARFPRRPDASRQAAIPPMAILMRERRVGIQRFCDYQYLRRVYTRPVGATQHCPRTPHFFN